MGDDLLIAPMLWPQRDTVDFYLPKGEWEQCWSGDVVVTDGQFMTGECPIGQPVVYFRRDSRYAELFGELKLLVSDQ